ncbi:hypothetical protein [Bacillus sp. FJAT-27251]|uniref:hypothetical protein n=1 Tax=Bacillus sp. FJAT-27251 TaxID=1684142 RepID=UPI0006A78B6C|nr:hypothetical protein [Bacillus sp. FJAT-27251]
MLQRGSWLANFVSKKIHNVVAYISGQVPRINGEVPYTGKVCRDVTVEQAQELAEFCVLKGLSSLKAAISNKAIHAIENGAKFVTAIVLVTEDEIRQSPILHTI